MPWGEDFKGYHLIKTEVERKWYQSNRKDKLSANFILLFKILSREEYKQFFQRLRALDAGPT